MPNSSRQVFARYMHAVNTRDLATARELAHPEWEDFYPQSGELTRGIANLEAIVTNYPGGTEGLGQQRIIGGEERFVRSPTFTLIRLEGSEEMLTGIQRARYPDGAVWFVIIVGEMRDGLVYRTETFFAPAFEPPAWRSAWVEIRSQEGG